jgi:hypothetical protein
LEDLSDARECIEGCDSELATECVDDFLDPKNKGKDKIKDLAKCCGLDSKCEKTLDSANDCIGACFDDCLQEAPSAYIDCLADEECSAAACSAELSDVNSGDEDAESIEKKANKLSAEDLENCDEVDKYYKDVCKAGKDCCRECNDELATVVSCMINKVVIPVIEIELNKTIAECPVDDKCKYGRRRGLNDGGFMGLPQKDDLPQSERNFIKEAMMKRVLSESKTEEECETDFENNMIMTDVSDASTIYMDCLLQVEPVTAEETSGSPACQMATLVATLLASLVVSF